MSKGKSAKSMKIGGVTVENSVSTSSKSTELRATARYVPDGNVEIYYSALKRILRRLVLDSDVMREIEKMSATS